MVIIYMFTDCMGESYWCKLLAYFNTVVYILGEISAGSYYYCIMYAYVWYICMMCSMYMLVNGTRDGKYELINV